MTCQRHFLCHKRRRLLKNIRSGVKNEFCFQCIVDISNVNLTSKNMGQVLPGWTGREFGMKPNAGGPHYNDVIMDAMAFQTASPTIVHSNIYSGAYQIKHQSSASLVFVWEIPRSPVNAPHKWLVTRKMFHLMTSSWSRNFNCTGKIFISPKPVF